jgi:hypothetical protein
MSSFFFFGRKKTHEEEKTGKMKKCVIGYGKYDSDELTPEGFSFCARHELLGMRRKGRDGKWYEVNFHNDIGQIWVRLSPNKTDPSGK